MVKVFTGKPDAVLYMDDWQPGHLLCIGEAATPTDDEPGRVSCVFLSALPDMFLRRPLLLQHEPSGDLVLLVREGQEEVDKLTLGTKL